MIATINLFTLMNLIQDYYGPRFKKNCRVSMLPYRAAPSNIHTGRWIRHIEPKKTDDSNIALTIVLPFEDEDHCYDNMGQVILHWDDMVRSAEEIFEEIKGFELPIQDLVEPFCFLPSHYGTVCKTLETLEHSLDIMFPPDPSLGKRGVRGMPAGMGISQYVRETMSLQDELRKKLDQYSPRYYEASIEVQEQLISPNDVQQFIISTNTFIGTVLIELRK